MRERDVLQFTFDCDRFSRKGIDINEAKWSKSLIPFSHKAKTLFKVAFQTRIAQTNIFRLLISSYFLNPM